MVTSQYMDVWVVDACSGPGVSEFSQGTTRRSILGKVATVVTGRASDRQTACHSPKPILLNTGEMENPNPWQAHDVSLHDISSQAAGDSEAPDFEDWIIGHSLCPWRDNDDGRQKTTDCHSGRCQ